MLKKLLKDPICNISYRGIKGALLGLLSGLLLGLLIWGILQLVDFVFPVESSFSTMPPSTIAFLGMGFGAIIGGIFGACVCLKQMMKRMK